MCPFQMWANGLIVEDCSHQFEIEGRRSRKSFVCPKSGLEFPLALFGAISCLPVSTNIQEELLSCEDIELTSGYVTWNPNDDDHEKEEHNIAVNQYGMRHGGRRYINMGG